MFAFGFVYGLLLLSWHSRSRLLSSNMSHVKKPSVHTDIIIFPEI